MELMRLTFEELQKKTNCFYCSGNFGSSCQIVLEPSSFSAIEKGALKFRVVHIGTQEIEYMRNCQRLESAIP